MKDLKNKKWIGVVEDNVDPKHLGRVRVRVLDIFDDLPLESIPWATPIKDLNGNEFNIPDKGKVVSVKFESSIYYPEYTYTQHYNPNLQEKLNRLDEEDYVSMKSVLFDEKTQIYTNEGEGLKLDYKYNNLNIQKDFISLNLKDNSTNLYLGDAMADQQAVLGNHWMTWFDKFVSNLLGENAGPYLGNYGAPVIANPAMIQVLLEYKTIRETFLSDHVKIVDDNQVNEVKSNKEELRVDIDQIGDEWDSTIVNNKVEKTGQNNKPGDGVKEDNPPNIYIPPSTDTENPIRNSVDDNAEQDVDIKSLEGNEELTKIISVLERKNYKINKRPFEPNIVGIRTKINNSKVTNKFDETMHYFFITDKGSWIHRKYKITTVPGYGKSFKRSKNKKLPDSKQSKKGVAVLVPGQYQDFWSIRKHGGKYEALGQKYGTKLPVMRQGVTDYYDFTVPISRDGGGINIHRSMPWKEGQTSEGNNIYNWSEGCQVFKSNNQFKEFMKYNYKFREVYGENSFTYTLILSNDII